MSTSPFQTLSVTGRRWARRAETVDNSQNMGGENRGDGGDLVDQILRARGCPEVDLPAYRAPTLRAFLPDPGLFTDMERAAERLVHAIVHGENVTIFGDYDVDGATSAALLVRYLRALGLNPGTYIPDRLREGYGPSAAALTALARQGASLVITVDCGAQAFEALAAAADVGLDVVVVDHHQCADALPRAHALVNPNRKDEGQASAYGHLAAVGVAFLLAAATTRALRQSGFFADGRGEPDLLALLDLVALGTVADVAPLRSLNRAFVTQGLKVMRRRRNPGIAALFDIARLSRAPQAGDLGFLLGPRINAGGRVGQADLGVRLLTTEDEGEAAELAALLDGFNTERRAIEAEVQAEAEAQAESQAEAPVIIVSGAGWHPGVIGIVAGRLKERYERPALVIALDAEGVGKGSGRSITGVDLGAAVLAAKAQGHLLAGGGHAMAAGLTIATADVVAFSAFLRTHLAEAVAAARQDRALTIDLVLAPRGLSPQLVETLEQGGPYGMGWPAPRIAAGPFRLLEARTVGGSHVRTILAGDDGARIKAMAFRAADTALGAALLGAPPHRRLWAAGRARIDDWGSRPTAELHLDDIAWAD